jgi:hypothetical protein
MRAQREGGMQDACGSGAQGVFQYLFHVDIAGNLAHEHVQNALRHLAEFAPFLRVLGCYPCSSGAAPVDSAAPLRAGAPVASAAAAAMAMAVA